MAALGARVSGWDPDPNACMRALELGAMDERRRRSGGRCRGGRHRVRRGPVRALVETVREALDLAGEDTVVADVGSTKRVGRRGDLGPALRRRSSPRGIGGGRCRACPRGPVRWRHLVSGAGCQHSGCPARTVAPSDRELRRRAGCDRRRHARPPDGVRLPAPARARQPARRPGRRVARRGRAGGQPGELATGPSFRDATRVAGSNSAIWTDIYMSNRDALLAAIDELTGRLAQVRALLDADNTRAVRDWNESARADRDALLGQADQG